MAKRNQHRDEPIPSVEPESGAAIWLRFEGELLELTASAEYPFQILQTTRFEAWIDSIVDLKTNARIVGNVEKMKRGLFGDWKDVGEGVNELRLDFGPGYRIYYARHLQVIVVLLAGGEKSTQRKDFANAKHVWKELKHEITQV